MNNKRMRLRDLGINIGKYPTGKYNSITDVAGVMVGHSTIIKGKGKLKVGKGPIRTGVTAILPMNRNIFHERIVGSGFILNGAGEVSGMTQLMEWGLIETPILLTNTLSVGACSKAVIKYMVKKYPGIGKEHDVIIPVVGECDDSWLNDIGGNHVKTSHVYNAIRSAKSGYIEEGNVGGGTGMVTCDFKGGIGTSSRKILVEDISYTLGVLVMSNFGSMDNLRIDGMPVGKKLTLKYTKEGKRINNYGSIIAVIGTDAPLSSLQLNKVCKRAALGIGRAGSYAAHESGEIVLGFSNANVVPRKSKKMIYRAKLLLEGAINPFYEAVIEATEEAIINSICMADSMHGHSDHFAPALPLDEVKKMFDNI